MNLTTASIVNARSLSLSVGPGSLVILGPGMNPATTFGSFSNYGMTLTGGTTLVIGPGQGFSGWGPINDPINCQGTISAQPGGGISLAGSLSLTGTCVVSLGSGNVTTQDFTSQISGGLLSSNYHYVGYTSPGVFTQCGGSNSVSADLVVGYRPRAVISSAEPRCCRSRAWNTSGNPGRGHLRSPAGPTR